MQPAILIGAAKGVVSVILFISLIRISFPFTRILLSFMPSILPLSLPSLYVLHFTFLLSRIVFDLFVLLLIRHTLGVPKEVGVGGGEVVCPKPSERKKIVRIVRRIGLKFVVLNYPRLLYKHCIVPIFMPKTLRDNHQNITEQIIYSPAPS